ncbi:hypothetical protein AYO44_06050 [Planctomycetaceae bacterium SCGC AG-212-F19]|nr:hypothetical protein AYO44_06050 [Planctomycetaceae bacterium SCGC AG-212-F19]
MGLPLLEAMVPVTLRAAEKDAARRLACFYVPNGVCNVEWIPETAGPRYQLSPTLRVLEDLKDDFTVISGMCHPNVEGDHSGGDTFLTAVHIGATPGYSYRNSISLDQVAADHLGKATRFPSLVLSRQGGTGEARKSATMSFSREGVPLAAENHPHLVFERLFQDNSPTGRAGMEKRHAEERSILDLVQESSRDLHRRLGHNDRQKLDEYLTSVRAVEGQIRRSEAWLNVPKTRVDASKIDLKVNPRAHDELKQYLGTMFDLIFLAFQTDTTRVCTFQLDQEVANHPFTKFLGFTDTYHGLSHHGGDPDMLKKLAQVDRFYLDQLGAFMRRLKAAPEGAGTMLDRTLILYGSGMNNGERGGHFKTNLPILFAGGRHLGLKQGQHLAYKQSEHNSYKTHASAPPFSNLFCTMLTHLEVPVKAFADSTGCISGLAGRG